MWITFIFSNANTIVMFAVTLVLARLLTPEEVGVFSIAVAFINFVAVFRDWGGRVFLIRSKDLTDEQIGSVLGLMITTSWALAAAMWLGKQAFANYFKEDQIAVVLSILIISFLLVPFASVLSALLVRNLSAGRNAFVTLTSTAVYAVTCIGLAANDHGSAAPAWANVANLVCNVVCYWIVKPKGFRFQPRFRGWREVISYGGGVALSNAMTTINQALPDFAIGRSLGAHEVGLFSRANGLVGLLHQGIGPVLNFNALPILARRHHEAPEEFIALFSKSLAYLTVIAWPVLAFIAIYPEEIIALLYGPTWLAAAPLVPWLCAAEAARVSSHLVNPALYAIGRPYASAFIIFSGLAGRMLLIVVLGAADLVQVAICFFVADIGVTLASGAMVQRCFGFRPRMLLSSQTPSLKVLLACAVVSGSVAWIGDETALSGLAVLGIAAAATALTWVTSIHCWAHPVMDEVRKKSAKKS